MINTADFAFIDALSNPMGLRDWIIYLRFPFFVTTLILFVVGLGLEMEYDTNNKKLKKYILSMVYALTTFSFTIFMVSLFIPSWDDLSTLDSRLARMERSHPEVYDQVKADHIRNLYGNCYYSNGQSCPVENFIKWYMIENWNTKTN